MVKAMRLISYKNISKRKRALLIGLAAILCFAAAGAYLRLRFPINYVGVVIEYSALHGLDPAFVCAVINAESGFDNEAVSYKNARGLMQLTNVTADWMAEELRLSDYSFDRIFEPELNILMGTYYLQMLTERYGGRPTEVLAAYNAGSGNVAKWLADSGYSKDGITLDRIPFKETRNYINRVNRGFKVYSIYLKYLF